MIRRFNYTDRTTIAASDVHVELIPGTAATKTFKTRLNLGDYDLPPDGHVFLEAYEKVAFMRFDFGTVGALKEPPKDKLYLSEFEGSDGVRFRLRIVDVSSRVGRIVAEASAIMPRAADEAEQDRISLLPVKFAPLDEQAWCLQIADSSQEMPILLVNDKVPDRNAFVLSASFMALAFPAILRQVLTYILAENEEDLELEDSWQAKWITFGRSFLFSGAMPPDDNDEQAKWIEDVVAGFCKQYSLFTALASSGDEV